MIGYLTLILLTLILGCQVAGAFAGLAMGINAIATARMLPIVWGLFG